MPSSYGLKFERSLNSLTSRFTRAIGRAWAVRTPAVLQAETTECGLAALATLLGYYGTHVTLEELRHLAGSTRMGVSALTMLEIAKRYGFVARIFRTEVEGLAEVGFPLIAYCRFVHFVVVEQITDGEVRVNDPSVGPDRIPIEEFNDDFTGLALTVSPSKDASRQGSALSSMRWLWNQLGSRDTRLLGSIALSIAAAAGVLVLAWSVGRYIDSVAAGAAGWTELVPVCVAAGLTYCAAWARDRASVATVAQRAREMSFDGLERLGRLPAYFFSNPLSVSIIANARRPEKH